MLDPMASRFGQAAILSGLMNVEGLTACWDAISPEKREAPEHIDRRLARQAVQSRALTLWQAQQLLAGRSSGFKVDRYILLELIGQGGMGRVYLAQDTRLGRRVALKILAPERISNPRAVARFQREARVGAQLQHENLVRVYDFGESNGRFFLVMEFIEGKTIGHLLSEQGPMPAATAVRLVRQVAQGLAHADRKGLIHRDVNPYNILVTHDGVAKLADLGLAIDLAEGDRVTREGATVGTFDYVAPEQARHSHSADIRSDIYSLGCTLYHMLTGHVPFPSPSLPEKLFAHQAMEPTPLEQVVPGLPAGLGDVVRTMMRKQPDERYSSPSQVLQALEPYLGDGAASRTEPVRSPSESSPRPGPDGRVTPVSGSEDGLRRSGSGSDGSSEGRPVPVGPQPDQGHVLAATAAPPVTVVSASRAAATRPGSPVLGTAMAGTSTPASAELDDQSLPLLTPTDDVAPEEGGLPILVDLGPEPPLRTVAARSRSSPWGGLGAIFTRGATSARPAETPAAGTSSTASAESFWRTLPLWGGVAILMVVVALTLLALLALTGRLAPLRRPRHLPAVPSGTPSDRKLPDASRRPPSEGPAIVVHFQGSAADEAAGVPAKTLLDALKASMGRRKDGYVELRNRAPLHIRPADFLDLSTWSGNVDLRAAPGVQPVIDVQMDGDHPYLATGSGVSLSLTGLTIRVHYPATAGAATAPPPPVISAAGRVQIRQCAFEVAGPRPEGCRALVSDGGNLSMTGCWFLGFDQPLRIKAYDETNTEIRQTMIVPQAGAAPVAGPSPELRGWVVGVELLRGRTQAVAPKRRLVLDHCTIEGAGLLALAGDPGPSPLSAEVSHCAVRSEAMLAWQPRKPGDRLDVDLRWKGLGNQFQVLGASWVVMAPGTMTPTPSLTVTDLVSWGKFVFREAAPIRTRIHYQTGAQQRIDSPRPRDFAIESAEPPADRAGADPDLVGPWGR